MTKPIAVFPMCNNFGVNIYDIDEYYDEAVFWNWSNESNAPDERRKSNIQYDKEGEPFFMAGTETEIYLSECIKCS